MSSNPSPWQPPGQPGTTPPPPPPPQGPPLTGYQVAPPQPGYTYPGAFQAGPGVFQAGYGMPPGYGPAQPPRPDTKVSGFLMLGGALVIAIGCFLPWLSVVGDESFNGFDNVFDDLFLGSDQEPSGYVFMFLAAVMLGFGITTLAAKRLLPIMIIGIVVASISLLGSLAEYSDYRDVAGGGRFDTGAGLPVVILGSAIALGGAIAGCSKRRRWPAR